MADILYPNEFMTSDDPTFLSNKSGENIIAGRVVVRSGVSYRYQQEIVCKVAVYSSSKSNGRYRWYRR